MAEVIPLLPPKRIRLADSARNVWRVVAEEGHTREQILHPTYWAHAAQQFREGDIVEVVCDTDEFFIELYVTEKGRGFVAVHELRFIDFTKGKTVEAPNADFSKDYEVKWKGPHKKFCVIRKQDEEAIKTEFPKKEDAILWMSQYVANIPLKKEA